MSARSPVGPTRTQELLLQAALWEGKAALAAWRAWRAEVDLDRLDKGSQRLLPLLYRNLRACGVADDAQLSTFKGFYRRALYQNKMLFRPVSIIVAELERAGIETMLLKGIALACAYYAEAALRPMDDADVMVHPGQALLAVECLRQAGWLPSSDTPAKLSAATLASRHSHSYKDNKGNTIDLHWHLLFECCGNYVDDTVWAGSVPQDLGGVVTRAPNATDLLLHICAHGAMANPIPPFRWVADAVTVLRRTEIDWPRLCAEAERRRLVLPLHATLAYLNETMRVTIPGEVLQTLRRAPVSRLDAWEWRAKRSPRGSPWRSVMYLALYRRHLAAAQYDEETPLPFFSFVQHAMGMESAGQMGRVLASRFARRAQRG